MTTIYSTPTSITVASGTDRSADWLSRSAASGVYFAENWASYADAAAAYSSAGCAGANKRPSDGALFTNAFELITTPGHVLSGKALRLWHGKNNYGSPGAIDNQYWIMPCNGNKNNLAGAYKTKLYVQVCIWVDSFIDYYWKLADGSVGGSKFFIIDDWDKSASRGEMVINNGANRGFICAYRDTPSSNGIERSLSTPYNNANFALNNAVDNGTPLTDQNSYERRYGPVTYGMTVGTSQASRLSTQGVPDPDAAAGTVAWNRGGITVVECELDLANDRLRYWAAHHGNPPKLLGDTNLDNTFGMNNRANVGTRVGSLGTGWSAMQLSNLVYTATGAQNPNYPTDAYIDYAEIIFSGKPIAFPGGFTPPGV